MKAYCKRKIIVVGCHFSLDGVVLVVCGGGGGLGAVEKTVPVRCCNVEGRWRVRRPWGGGRRRPWPASVTSRAKPANLLPLASSRPPPPHTTRPDHLSNCLATVYSSTDSSASGSQSSAFRIWRLGWGVIPWWWGGGVSDGFDFFFSKGAWPKCCFLRSWTCYLENRNLLEIVKFNVLIVLILVPIQNVNLNNNSCSVKILSLNWSSPFKPF